MCGVTHGVECFCLAVWEILISNTHVFYYITAMLMVVYLCLLLLFYILFYKNLRLLLPPAAVWKNFTLLIIINLFCSNNNGGIIVAESQFSSAFYICSQLQYVEQQIGSNKNVQYALHKLLTVTQTHIYIPSCACSNQPLFACICVINFRYDVAATLCCVLNILMVNKLFVY